MPVLRVSNPRVLSLSLEYMQYLQVLETQLHQQYDQLSQVCQESELSYLQRHYQNMLHNIQKQKQACKNMGML